MFRIFWHGTWCAFSIVTAAITFESGSPNSAFWGTWCVLGALINIWELT